MPTLAEMKTSAKRAQKKTPLTPYQKRMNEKFGSFNKVKKIKKTEKSKPLVTFKDTPKSNFNRVMAQLITNAHRKEYDSMKTKPKLETIPELKMPHHNWPSYPNTRKGSGGQVLSFEEQKKKENAGMAKLMKEKKEFLAKGHTLEDWWFSSHEGIDTSNHEIDIERVEVELDYGQEEYDGGDE
tara:strand:+ start:194 stop:742 length:549 start_codon:yes stop_codon:yes gene_type:complete